MLGSLCDFKEISVVLFSYPPFCFKDYCGIAGWGLTLFLRKGRLLLGEVRRNTTEDAGIRRIAER